MFTSLPLDPGHNSKMLLLKQHSNESTLLRLECLPAREQFCDLNSVSKIAAIFGTQNVVL